MRRAFVLVVLLSACSSDASDGAIPAIDVQPITKQPNLPQVDDANIVLAPGLAPQPAAFVWIGPNGKLELAPVGPRWTGEPPTNRHLVIMPNEIRTEVLQAALRSTDAIREAAQAQLLGKDAAAAPIDSNRQSTALIVRATELDSVVPVVSTNPNTPALSVARVLVRTGGLFAVTHDKRAHVLMFGGQVGAVHASPTGAWAEMHVDGDGIHVVTLPQGVRDEVPWTQGKLDRDGLKTAYETLQSPSSGLGPNADIDLLIGADVDTQRFVDIVVALHALGAKRLFVGERPPGTIADRVHPVLAGVHTPSGTVRMGVPNAQGDLDKAIIRRYIRRNTAKFQYCYEKQLLKNDQLAGTVSTQFFIGPDGQVVSSNAAGVDPDVASCVAEVIKNIEFPKPKGGGGVQVNYPMTFELAGP